MKVGKITMAKELKIKVVKGPNFDNIKKQTQAYIGGLIKTQVVEAKGS